MKATKHTPMKRFGKFEQPVTITTDSGDIIDTVLLFDSEPNNKQVADAVVRVIARNEAIKNEQQPEPDTISIAEVETVLRGKNILSIGEKWSDFKIKPINDKIIKEK
jgi:hypothetical protein